MTVERKGSEVGTWLGLAGRVCVVTGAGSGIGAETARQLAAADAWVAVLDRDGVSAQAVATEIAGWGGRAIGVEADVSCPESVQAAAGRVLAELGPCYVLVNNAAVRHRAPLLGVTLEAWRQVLDVNLTGALICTQVFSAQMIAEGKGGSIIHVSSLLGKNPQMEASPYCASKAGLGMLSRCAALELAPHRIRSNVVSPGFTRTPANEASYRDPATIAARERLIPSGRVATAADLAQSILMLASDRAGYINGEEIAVDGGVGCTLLGKVPRPSNA